jgi:octaprenyl-diphosphate synthase
MTLPLIHALTEATPKQRKYIIRTIKKHHDRPKKVQEVVDFVRHSGGLDYARLRMEEHITKAKDLLYTFPGSDVRDSFESLLEFTVARKK